jgi:hypothetical protein
LLIHNLLGGNFLRNGFEFGRPFNAFFFAEKSETPCVGCHDMPEMFRVKRTSPLFPWAEGFSAVRLQKFHATNPATVRTEMAALHAEAIGDSLPAHRRQRAQRPA